MLKLRFVGVALALILGPAAVAQRAPCTGTLRDVMGAPIVGATVVFAQEPWQTLGAEPDRVEVTTVAGGAFAAPLLPGSPYAVWALGPADAEGARWVTDVAMDGAAGKVLDLVATLRARPRRLSMHGVAAWRAHAPPALRVLIDGRHVFGPDRPVAGDGELSIGPLPDADVELAFVDDRREELCRFALRGPEATEVHLPEPKVVPVEVVDGDGRPVAGAPIVVSAGRPMLRTVAGDPLPVRDLEQWREAATTGVDGRAEVVVPWAWRVDDRDVTLVATAAGHAASISGFARGVPFADCRPVEDEAAPLRFVVRRLEPAALRLAGDEPQVRALQVLLQPFAARATSGHRLLTMPVAVRHGIARTVAPPTALAVTFCLRVDTGGEIPGRLCWAGDVLAAPLTAVALGGLRRRTVLVTDAGGRPVPFAHVAIGVERFRAMLWHDRCVADAWGRVSLLVDDSTWTVVASDARGVAVVEVGREAAGDEVVLRLEPLQVAHARVVDAAGEPVAGARVEPGLQPVWGRSLDPLDVLRQMCVVAAAATVRSAGDGYLPVPVPTNGLAGVVVRRGGQRSAPMALEATNRVTYVELHPTVQRE